MTKNKANYQMEFNWGGSSKSWEYFYATENIHEIACAVANEFMKKKKSATPVYSFLPRDPIKFPKKVLVRQYDDVKKCPIKGGSRFVLTRTGFTMKTNIRTIKEEWYEFHPNPLSATEPNHPQY